MQSHDRPPLAIQISAYICLIVLAISTIFLFSALCLSLISVEITRFEKFLPDDPSEKFKLLVTLFGITSAALTSIFGVIVAILTYRNSVRNAEKSRKKQHTITIIFETRLSEQFQSANQKRKKVFPAYHDIQWERWEQIRTSTVAEEIEGAEALQMLLNYYEFLAVGIRQNDLDEEMLKGTIRGIMCNLVDDARFLIAELNKQNPRTLEHLIWLYEKWRLNGAIDTRGNPTERPIPKS